MNPNIVGIRFQRVGKIYHFDAANIPDLQPCDFVVVETSRGTQMGQVIHTVKDPQRPPEGAWKPIHRKATARDLVLRQVWQQKEAEAVSVCRSKANEIRLVGVKIIGAEYSFDGSRLSFYVSSDEDDKVDLRDLRRVIQRIYPQAQIDFHQLGPRDVAKVLGGMGACGLDNRCCSRFLTDFSPISIKMAKEQGISLTPTEITGMCGRLRCCLVYEYEQYVEARSQLPKRNKRVVTPAGDGKVLDVYPLSQRIVVLLDTGVQQEFAHEDIQPFDELEAIRQKAQKPCINHPEGGCNCAQQSEIATANDATPLPHSASLESRNRVPEETPDAKPVTRSPSQADTPREKTQPVVHHPQRDTRLAAGTRPDAHAAPRPEASPGNRGQRRPAGQLPEHRPSEGLSLEQIPGRVETRETHSPKKKAGKVPGGKPNRMKPRPNQEKRKRNSPGKSGPQTEEEAV